MAKCNQERKRDTKVKYNLEHNQESKKDTTESRKDTKAMKERKKRKKSAQ